MTDQVWTPTNSAGKREPGLDAVAAKFGARMVARFRAWPKLAETYARAAGADDVLVAQEVALAHKNLNRAGRDREYAVAQAEEIARLVESDRWDVVPTVDQLRREWWPPVRPEQAALVSPEGGSNAAR